MKSKNRIKFRASAQKGFALLETLISFVIMAVGILALLSFHSQSQVNVAEAKTQAEAVAIAEGRLQQLESYLTEDDARLSIATATEDVVGQLATYTLTSAVTAGANGELRVATVTVSWNDRNGDQQQVLLSSEIHYEQPTEGAEAFLTSLTAVANVRDIAENGSDNPWVVPGGSDDIGDGRDIVERIANDLYAGTIPDGYQYENVYIFRIYLSGTITKYGNGSARPGNDFVVDAPAVDSITGQAGTSYVSSCNVTNTGYSCSLYYLSLWDGWNGDVTYTLRQGIFCSPATGQDSFVQTFQSLYEHTTLDLDIAPSLGDCPA